MINLGIVRPGSTLIIPFDAFNSSGASVTISGLAVTDVEVYKDSSMTQRGSDNGYTLLDTDGTDEDSITGIHGFSIDLADNSTAGFWAAGSKYRVVIASITIDSQTVNFTPVVFEIGYAPAVLNTTIATLSSQTSFTLTSGPAEDNALKDMWAIIHDVASAVQWAKVPISAYTGSTKTVTLPAGATFTVAAGDNISIMGPMPLQGTTAGNTADVNSGGEMGLDWGNIGNKTTTNAFTGTTIATTQKVDVETIKTNPVVNAGTVTFPSNATLASTTNITAGTITTTTNLTNDPTGVGTLLLRITATRAGLLDNLNIGGVVASQADINALNQSASRRVLLVTVLQYERPESGSSTYTVEARTFDGDGAVINADSNPTLTATGIVSGSLAANLSAITNPATGVYRWTYTVSSAAAIEQIRFDVSATISSSTFTLSTYTQVADFVSATFTSTHASQIAAIFNKLPSKSYIAGTSNSDGDVQLDEATGTALANVTKWSGTDVATPDTPGYPKCTIKSGIGAGEIALSFGNVSTVDGVNTISGGAISAASFASDALAAIKALVTAALADIHLDHLIASADPTGVVANNSFLAKLSSKTGVYTTFTASTDSLEAIRDRGDSSWSGGGGGGGDQWATEITEIVYPNGTAGFMLLTAYQRSLQISAGGFEVISPIDPESDDIRIYQGDDYQSEEGRTINFADDDWPDLTGSVVTFKLSHQGTTILEVEADVTAARACSVSLTNTQTAALTKNAYDWQLRAVLANTHKQTLGRAKFHRAAEL